MDINEIRRINLASLIGSEHKDKTKFCTKHGLDLSYVSQIINNHRNLGEKAARKMEVQIGLETGYLDGLPDRMGDPVKDIETALNKASWLNDKTRKSILDTVKSLKK